MEISDWLKIPAAIYAFAFLSKFLYDLASGKRTKLREEYRFAKELLNDISAGSLHPYAKEKGYQALVGSTDISVEEIEYILTLKNPSKCLKDYVLAQSYLEKVESRGNTQLRFKAKYQSKRKRLLLVVWYITWYVLFALLVISPFALNRLYDVSLTDFLILVSFSSTFAFPAWLSLQNGARIVRGQSLVEKQRYHSWELEINGWDRH